MNTTFRKMYTPEEIKSIAGGGGAGLEVIEITDVPTTSTSGTLNEAQMAIVNSDTPSCVKFNNEYYYKNTLLNKLLLGVHSPRTTTALTEVPVGNSKADFILINGKAVVYEIKTALDNFDRLDGQIEDYYKAFSRVVVVTSEKNFDDIQQRLRNSPAGICLLTKKGTLSVRKEPIEYSDMLSKPIMFKILRKNEYEQILLKHFGLLPDVSQFEYYRACQAMFESLPTDVAYQMFVQTLKLRAKIDVVEYSKIPYELKFLIYFSNYKKSDYAKLCRFLST